MGLIADFLVATPEEATRYASSGDIEDENEDWDENEAADAQYVDPRDGIERLEWKGFTGLEMGLLWADLVDVPWDVNRHMLVDAAHESDEDGGMWSMSTFPKELVEVIVSVPPARIEAGLAQWREREALRGADPADLHAFFDGLRALARSAQAQGKDLYLYNVA